MSTPRGVNKPCPVREGNEKCGETETLAIIQEFRQLYERKMNKLDQEAGGDNLPGLQAKVNLQMQWIKDLNAQNELLVQAVENLETEATSRVLKLEEKLRSSDTGDVRIPECMTRYREMQKQLDDKESELQRLRQQLADGGVQPGSSSDEAARIQELQQQLEQKQQELQESQNKEAVSNPPPCNMRIGELMKQLEEKDRELEGVKTQLAKQTELAAKAAAAPSHTLTAAPPSALAAASVAAKSSPPAAPPPPPPSAPAMAPKPSRSDSCDERIKDMERKLQQKEKDLQSLAAKCQQQMEETNAVRRSLKDTRNALTVEVAEKHDVIVNLRREMVDLEEKCRISNQQTQFRDVKIKDLRKQLKSCIEEESEEKNMAIIRSNIELQDKINRLSAQLKEPLDKLKNVAIETDKIKVPERKDYGQATTVRNETSDYSSGVFFNKETTDDSTSTAFVQVQTSDKFTIQPLKETASDDTSMTISSTNYDDFKEMKDEYTLSPHSDIQKTATATDTKSLQSTKSIGKAISSKDQFTSSPLVEVKSKATKTSSSKDESTYLPSTQTNFKSTTTTSSSKDNSTSVTPTKVTSQSTKTTSSSSRDNSTSVTPTKVTSQSTKTTSSSRDNSTLVSPTRVAPQATSTTSALRDNTTSVPSTKVESQSTKTTNSGKDNSTSVPFTKVASQSTKTTNSGKDNSTSAPASKVASQSTKTTSSTKDSSASTLAKRVVNQSTKTASSLDESTFTPIAQSSMIGSSALDLNEKSAPVPYYEADQIHTANIDNWNVSSSDDDELVQLKRDIMRSIDDSLERQPTTSRPQPSKEANKAGTSVKFKRVTEEYVVQQDTETETDNEDERYNKSSIAQQSLNVDNQIKGLQQIACQDYNLFCCMGKELDHLLQHAYDKDREIANQKDVIQFLVQRLILFHQRYSELKELHSKKKSQNFEEDSNTLRARIKALEDDNKKLQIAASEGKRNLENAEKRANQMADERDNFRRKSDALESLPTVLEECQQQHDKALTQITALSAENADLHDELQRLRAALKGLEDGKEVITGLQNLDSSSDYKSIHQQSKHVTEVCDTVCPGSGAVGVKVLEECPGETCVKQEPCDSKTIRFNINNVDDKTRSTTSTSTETWQTTDSEKTIDEEIECECTLTVIQTTEHSFDPLCEQRISQLEAELDKNMRERQMERVRHDQELMNLKQTLSQMQESGSGTVCPAGVCQNENMQSSIIQQQQTILNLQEALISTKRNLEDLQQKSAKEVSIYIRDIYQLKGILTDTELKCLSFASETENLSGLIENLRDANLDLEVENFISNQDLAILEARLLKYQQNYKYNEECSEFKAELVRLLEENKKQITANASLQDQLMSLTGELHQMQQIANEAKDLQMILQKANEEMQSQASLAEHEIHYEVEPLPQEEVDVECHCSPDRKGARQAGGGQSEIVLRDNLKMVPTTHSTPVSPQDLMLAVPVVYDVSPYQGVTSSQNELCRCTLDTYDNVGPQEINDLKVSLDQKQLELNQFEDLLFSTQEKLDVSLAQYEELRSELQQLICQIRGYENQNSSEVDDCTVCCQKEIDLCKENLCDLKAKFEKVKELLNERNDQFAELEAKHHTQSQACACLKRQLQGSKLQYEGDVTELKQTISILENKLRKAEINCECFQKECKRKHELLVETSVREQQLKERLSITQEQYAEKLNESQVQEQRFCQCISQLESKTNGMMKDINTKERQLELATAHINELKSAAKSQLNMAHEEINTMRNDMQTVVQEHNNVKAQNEQLQACLCQSQATSAKYEKMVKNSREELQQCICELEAMKTERNYLENINIKLSKELKMLHTAYANLNRDFQEVTESVIYLESELIDSKINQNNLCLESRNIINNIKGWLEDQVVIKNKCEQKIQSDQLQIFKLRQHISLLEEFSNKCNCNATRQRGGTTSMTPRPGHPWSPGSQGTSSSCADSEFSNNAEWTTYDDGGEESLEEYPSGLWLNQVHKITKGLRKTNRYWKMKALDDYMVSKDK